MNGMNDDCERDGAPVLWLALAWAGLLVAVTLCLLIVAITGGVL